MNEAEAVTATALDYFEGWYLHLVRTPEGWRIVNTVWQLTEPGGGSSA